MAKHKIKDETADRIRRNINKVWGTEDLQRALASRRGSQAILRGVRERGLRRTQT
jgi:hypothetical protein